GNTFNYSFPNNDIVLFELEENNKFIPKNEVLLKINDDNYQDLKTKNVEKNWCPFVYKGELLLIYSFGPLIILKPNLETGICKVVKIKQNQINLNFLRGSSSGIYYKDNFYFMTHEVYL